jgi:glutathione S-transferase
VKLLGSEFSPYTRKVRLVLLEKRLPFEWVIAAPRDPDSPVPMVNPLGRIPTLLLDDGAAIYDSPVICEYLDGLCDDPALIPREPGARLRVKLWEALADGVMDSAFAMRMESLRPPEKQDPSWAKLHGDAISRALAHAAAQLRERVFCEGGALTLADLALVSALLYLDLRQPERDWRGAHPELRLFAERMYARESVRATLFAPA